MCIILNLKTQCRQVHPKANFFYLTASLAPLESSTILLEVCFADSSHSFCSDSEKSSLLPGFPEVFVKCPTPSSSSVTLVTLVTMFTKLVHCWRRKIGLTNHCDSAWWWGWVFYEHFRKSRQGKRAIFTCQGDAIRCADESANDLQR